MAYANTQDVAAYCKNLINGATDFSATTVPTKAEVENWLTSGCAQIEQYILSQGFTPPPAEGTALWSWLADLNALFAASRAEMARTNVRLSPGERTRGQQFLEMFKQGMEELTKQAMAGAGMTYSQKGYIGGISQSDKDSTNSNTDRVASRWQRGDFEMPGAGKPGTTTNTQTRLRNE